MPDSIEEVLDLLRRRTDEAMEQVHHAANRVSAILADEDSLEQLPARIQHSIVVYYNAIVDAVTAGGTLPSLSLPSLPGLREIQERVAPQAVIKAAPPPTWFERVSKHVHRRPYLYAVAGLSSLGILSTVIAIHLSPTIRAKIFDYAPFLTPIYIKRKKALPVPPRPRLSPDGKHRVEAVLILGADHGTYGREVAKSFEKKGFVVIASVSHASDIDALERCGSGFIKAITLDASRPSQASSFIRSLNTALSLRYPLNSAGDPFNFISSSNPGLQLVSVINCLPISTPFGNGYLPMEALSSEAINEAFTSLVTMPLALLRSICPIMRSSRDSYGTPTSIITCVSAPDRYVSAPFTGTSGAIKGVATNALLQSLDILRRELNATSTACTGEQRQVNIRTIDVGFLQPVNTRRTHRGTCHDPPDARFVRPTAQDLDTALPHHLKHLYTRAIMANIDSGLITSTRGRIPDANALSNKLLALVLHPDSWSNTFSRDSVGRGVMTYYVASLMPTRVIDVFFAIRQRLLHANFARHASPIPAVNTTDRRRPLPHVPSATSSSSSDPRSRTASRTSSDFASDSALTQEHEHENDTILPAYAPSAPASTQPASPARQDMPLSEDDKGYDSSASGSGVGNSTMLGESYVQV